MRIVVDLQSCQSGSRYGGIGRYSMNLVQAMARNAGSHDLHLVLSNQMPDGIADIYNSIDTLIPKSNIHFFQVPGAVSDAMPENIFRARAAELIRENFIFSLRPDIVHVTSLFEGLGDDVTTSIGRFCDGVTTAVTLYDLIPLVESEKYLTNEISKNHYFRKIDDLQNAGMLLAISEYSRIEAIQELGISPDRVTNISSAIDKKFKPWKVPVDIEKIIKHKYGITRKFLMYTGSFDQRKNHEALIKAFAALPIETRKEYQLLIVGNGWPGIYAHLEWIANGVGLSKDDILFAGKVPDDDLLPLYNLCFLFVFPSLREGFGLPVLEAMSCGVPVIGSNSTSIPEVLGTNKAMFDPTNINSISNKIYEAITDSEFRHYLIEHGLEHAKGFSWDASAKKAINAFEASYDARGKGYINRLLPHPSHKLIKSICALPEISLASDMDLVEISNSIEQIEIIGKNENKELLTNKIGLVSTWNTKCGIAMYSKYLTESEFDNYTIFAPVDNNVLSSKEKNVTRCWNVGDDSLIGLYQAIMNEKIKIVLIQFNYGFYDFSKLSYFIHKLIMSGREVSITLHSTADPEGYENKKLIYLKNALLLCSNIFVHSAGDVVTLNKLGLFRNVKIFPQGVYEPNNEPLCFRLTKDTFVVASYGFYLPHKGFHELIDAVHILKLEGINVHLLMINAEYDAPVSHELVKSARLKISELNMDNNISIISDFMSEDMSIRIMRNANLVVFPYQNTGESSSAAVRMGLASGIPVAVTPLSIFDDVSNAVFKLPGTEPKELALGIKMVRSELINESALSKEINTFALKWKEERGYSILAHRLKKQLCGDFKFLGSDPRICTQVGYREGQSLYTTGVAGYILYGPYIPLEPGCYCVVIHGSCGAESLADARMDVAIDKGNITLVESALNETDSNGCLAVVPISLDQPCTDFEVRIWVSELTDLQVSMIEIVPWQDEPVISQIVSKDIEQKTAQVSTSTSSVIQNSSRLPSGSRNQAKSKRKKRR